MKVRCKFYCSRVTEEPGSRWNPDTKQNESCIWFGARMHAVTGKSGENEQFFASTPNGSFEVNCTTKRFEPGKEYYIEIEEAQ